MELKGQGLGSGEGRWCGPEGAGEGGRTVRRGAGQGAGQAGCLPVTVTCGQLSWAACEIQDLLPEERPLHSRKAGIRVEKYTGLCICLGFLLMDGGRFLLTEAKLFRTAPSSAS